MHDTIGCYLDLDKGQIKFSKNGKFFPFLSFENIIHCTFHSGVFLFVFFLTLFSGKDLGLAFEIPPHVRNQALFASCVLKVILNVTIYSGLRVVLGFLNMLYFITTFIYHTCILAFIR